jgi:hypothetical protein
LRRSVLTQLKYQALTASAWWLNIHSRSIQLLPVCHPHGNIWIMTLPCACKLAALSHLRHGDSWVRLKLTSTKRRRCDSTDLLSAQWRNGDLLETVNWKAQLQVWCFREAREALRGTLTYRLQVHAVDEPGAVETHEHVHSADLRNVVHQVVTNKPLRNDLHVPSAKQLPMVELQFAATAGLQRTPEPHDLPCQGCPARANTLSIREAGVQPRLSCERGRAQPHLSWVHGNHSNPASLAGISVFCLLPPSRKRPLLDASEVEHQRSKGVHAGLRSIHTKDSENCTIQQQHLVWMNWTTSSSLSMTRRVGGLRLDSSTRRAVPGRC